MAITMYSASVPTFLRQLGQLTLWLDKAAAHAEAKKFDPAIWLAVRLTPDMLPLKGQVQIACDTAKFCVARLSGAEAPKFDDTESTVAELRERVTKTLDFIRSVPADALVGTEEKEVQIPMRSGPITLTGEAYLTGFAMPNFYFHATTTYALLRHHGVDLGKMDFLGKP